MGESTDHSTRALRSLLRARSSGSASPHFDENQHPDNTKRSDPSSLNFSMTELNGLNQSTQENILNYAEATETHEPKLRDTAQKFAYYNQPSTQNPIPTSAVHRAFKDFDSNPSDNGVDAASFDDSRSIELPRGVPRSSRNTPTKNAEGVSDNFMNSGLYDPATPPKKMARQRDNRDTLRREAATRRAVSVPQKDAEQSVNKARASRLMAMGKPAANEKRRSTLADRYARAVEEDIHNTSWVPDDRPDAGNTVTSTFQIKSTRFASHGGRSVSASAAVNVTPQRMLAVATPRSTQTGTLPSFMFPEMPNLTELVTGYYEDGTPIFSRARRFAPKGLPPNKNHNDLDDMTTPVDEKAIIAALQVLHEKIANLEQERSEMNRQLDDYENEIITLRTELESRQHVRYTDSAMSSNHNESVKDKAKLRVEKTKLETLVQTLQKRLGHAEHKASLAEASIKRLTQERDSAVAQIAVAVYNHEELKAELENLREENEALRKEQESIRKENEALHGQVDALDQDNFDLNTHLDRERQRQKDDVHMMSKAKADPKHQTANNVFLEAENKTLRQEIQNLRAAHENETHLFAQAEIDFRLQAEQATKAEHAKLMIENDLLRKEVLAGQEVITAEGYRAAAYHDQLEAKLQEKEEIIRRLVDAGAQDQENEALRAQIEELRDMLRQAKGVSDNDVDTELWRRLTDVNAKNAQEALKQCEEERAKVEGERLRLEQERKQAKLREEGALRQSHLHAEDKRRQREEQEKLRQMNQADRELENLRSQVAAIEAKRRRLEAEVKKVEEQRSQTDNHTGTIRPTSSISVRGLVKRTARARSKSRSRPAEPTNTRPTLTFAAHDVEISADLDQSADIELTRNTKKSATANEARRIASGTHQGQSATGDVTVLSSVGEDTVANLRKKLEMERASRARATSRATSYVKPSVADDDITAGITRRSSMKDVTKGLTRKSSVDAMVEGLRKELAKDMTKDVTVDYTEDLTRDFTKDLTKDLTKDITAGLKPSTLTQKSSLKNGTSTSVHQKVDDRAGSSFSARRAAPGTFEEMTSEFIIDDITMNVRPGARSAEEIINNPSPHDCAGCTVCQRIMKAPDAAAENITIPIPVPVSARPDYLENPNATIRPSMPPAMALARVLKELDDELAHLRMELLKWENKLAEHNPKADITTRKRLHRAVDKLHRQIEAKSDQIYMLFDVVEAHKEDLAAMNQDEVDNTIEEIRRGKRVKIQEGDDSMPWEGFSDSEE
ncbi:hypothetical protein EJ06DRAFT_533662 [Trichodelitschia bisporula]|uniref:Cep57 centrosome microtubule-binding domain-containing protein n=1 Tax=Trichodelitschia bisporula TaxID=703511 RepID=A0A6G1HM23_9PEZI|nr:hypothetical protein EJ06DRAFT_533662 [Trichodelitschia bisporula]